MPFVSKFNGHGRIPGIHKPAAPPAPTVTNTATTDTTLTFNIGNYDARWRYSGTISPVAGTISFSGATVTISGLTGSTSYTLTVSASGSGGIRSGSGSATTAAPPPFFPPFFPFFPYFPPFFPYFPPFFPYFPPFFPFFPPFFPAFGPFFPSFAPPPPPSKTAPTNSLRDIAKITVKTSDYGYLETKYLTEEDMLATVNIYGLDTSEITFSDEIATEIISVSSSPSVHSVYYINGDGYPENMNILVEDEGIKKFMSVKDITEYVKIFNYESRSFSEIISIELEEVSGVLYNIECSPNNYYVVQETIGYFS